MSVHGYTDREKADETLMRLLSLRAERDTLLGLETRLPDSLHPEHRGALVEGVRAGENRPCSLQEVAEISEWIEEETRELARLRSTSTMTRMEVAS